jgi:Holliday junction resolvase RusA-like endonuclease
MIIIELDGEPVPKGRPRFGRGHAYTPAKTRSFETDLGWAAKAAMKGRNIEAGPLAITIWLYRSVPKGWSKRMTAKALSGEVRPTTKPDWDNGGKITDALNKIVWLDDSQIVDALVRKFYSDHPRIRIEVCPVT